VRGRIPGQNADVHADGVVEAAEPKHRGTNEMGAAGCGVDGKADAGPDDASIFVAKCTVE